MPEQAISNIGSKASNCILLTITVICIGILVVCGVMVVREYSLAKGYSATSCRVVNISYSGDIDCVFCANNEKGKKDTGTGSCTSSTFPCLLISVAYSVQDVDYRGILHPDSLQAISITSQCSFGVCLKRPADNEAAVRSYADDWRRKSSAFPCFYDTTDSGRVIAHKMHSEAEVIHIMFWPSLVIVICGAIFLRFEVTRRGLTLCSADDKTPLDDQRYHHVAAPAGGGGSAQNLCQTPTGGKLHCRLLTDDGRPQYAATMSGSLPTLALPKQAAARTQDGGQKLLISHSHDTLRGRHAPKGNSCCDGAEQRQSSSTPCVDVVDPDGNPVPGVETPV